MPELPDITVYVERVRALVCGQDLLELRIRNPFVLRTVDPNPGDFQGLHLLDAHRMGKQIVLEFEDEMYAVIHLMIAGRLRWRPVGEIASSMAMLKFPNGSIFLTESGTKHRASLHLVKGKNALAGFERGGVSVFGPTEEFVAALRRENRTVKRALTDPAIVDGVGNAYSDEILHRARVSPFALTRSLDEETLCSLKKAAVEVLTEWTDRLRAQAGPTLPERVTAFHPEMAVHGKYGKPCPYCGTPIQRIVYAENEANYCPTCQTGGRLLADRALSRLLKTDWPKTLDELEKLRPHS